MLFKYPPKQSGFTLIELIVVIVILGILTVIAAPKFINFKRDARIAALQGVAAAIKGTANLAHAKATMLNVENGFYKSGRIDGKELRFNYRYPFPDPNGIPHLLDIKINGWSRYFDNTVHEFVATTNSNVDSDVEKYRYNVTLGELAGDGSNGTPAIAPENTGCVVQYIAVTPSKGIEVNLITSGC
ncbi:MAG: type II secretion system protein [Parashewanella sp.]